ncbi:cell shape determination protein CcmA [Pseudoxanthomonas sangjuensis]|uniref:bactofilin family protein n=1 Tax=Pseudoxanthomonas sangjuensis TaxID=1503750 RepID=UPI00139129F4|nr:polymer-forming cytoskeletal protein [Pseudoxanthomonas sangjuensis]KAF1715411.1 cell shape determination protein CcmA [Pseudoxanthomonas sangjuensis]
MSMWKDPGAKKDIPAPQPPQPAATPEFLSAAPAPVATPERSTAKESLISADLAIEGKIEGAGHVRIAGKFKGDVNVQGDLTIELGAKVNGSVKAKKVTVAGELEGNIDSATQVDVLASGAITGDVKAGAVTVANGARIRGHVDFGWNDDRAKSAKGGAEHSAAA